VTVTNYIWDVENDTCLMETDENGATKVVYSHEPTQFGGLISQRRDGETYYHHYDALGSTRQLTDSDENVTDEYVYTAWGEPVVASGTTENPYRWVGRWGYYWDEATGTYYVRRRDYQPAIARWMSVDFLGFGPIRSNLYLYAEAAPLVLIDPAGLEWMRVPFTTWWYPTDETDALTTLVEKVSAFYDVPLDPVRNRFCIRPSVLHLDARRYATLKPGIVKQWGNGLGHPCVLYDVGNLVDAWPSGGDVLASVGSDDSRYIEFASAFYGVPEDRRGITGAKLLDIIAHESGRGSKPLKSITIIGHSWSGEREIGSADGLQVFKYSDLPPRKGEMARPTWDEALTATFPPTCWLRTDATVRLVGCLTSGFARTIAVDWLRGRAKVYGTGRPTWAKSATQMGWAIGKLRKDWFPDNDAGFSRTREEYESDDVPDGWVGIEAKNR
jgi:RHS repeat-associated protein